MRAAGMLRTDLRGLVISALQFVDLGQPEALRDLGTEAKQLGIVMPAWQKVLFGDKLKPLLEHEAWFGILRR